MNYVRNNFTRVTPFVRVRSLVIGIRTKDTFMQSSLVASHFRASYASINLTYVSNVYYNVKFHGLMLSGLLLLPLRKFLYPSY
jgi:hypothetical protein